MTDGWIKLNRSICDSAVFADAEVLQLWIWLLCNAAYEECEVIHCGMVVHLNAGEVIAGRKKLAQELQTKECRTYRALQLLQELGNVSIKSNNKFSVITIVNWEKFQRKPNQKTQKQQVNSGFDVYSVNNGDCIQKNVVQSEQQNNSIKPNNNAVFGEFDFQKRTTKQQQDNSKTTAKQQQSNTNKEIKEIKEYKEVVEVYNAHARTRTHAREEATTPPTLSEVRNFCFERQSIVDPVRFYNYYSKQGWDIGDWKLKVEEWENNKFSTSDRERVEKLANYRSCVSSGISENAFEIFDEAIPLKAEGV